MTTDCNFKCKYCYEDYKKHLYLDQETLMDALKFIMNYGEKGKILLDFLGGEPLLKKDLIYEAVDYIKSKYPNRTVKYYVTTNGSLIDEQFTRFIKENHFSVRLSFDGNKKTHDLNRIAKDSTSHYEEILGNIMKVKECGLPYSVRMTITQNTIPYMYENICFLHEQGLDNINMIMDVNLKLTESLFHQFKKQVDLITEYYIHEYEMGRKFSLDQFDGKLLNILCDNGNKFCMCNAGFGNFKIMPDGSIYPCGFLTYDEQFAIGSIYEGVDTEKAHNIAVSNFDKYNRKCVGCQIRDFCHGMKCGYMNYIRTGKINIPSNEECQCEHVFYDSMVKIMDNYLKSPKEELKKLFPGYMEYIKESKLKLGDYGIRLKNRLQDE